MEVQYLSPDRSAELSRIMPIWQVHRETLARADVIPIGNKPTGRAFTGFFAETEQGKAAYLLLFREATDADTYVYSLPRAVTDIKLLAGNAEIKWTCAGDRLAMQFEKQRTYAFLRCKCLNDLRRA